MFIEKLDLQSDLKLITNEFDSIIDLCGWGDKNQIGLNHRIGVNNLWHDAAGSLYNEDGKTFISKETDYSEWNIGPESYTRQQIELLKEKENTIIGRCRFMRLLPKTGLSVHKDMQVRYHYVIKTNTKAYISVNEDEYTNPEIPFGRFYHIPSDGNWYKVDTKKIHWVYNGGNTERIHLVICGT